MCFNPRYHLHVKTFLVLALLCFATSGVAAQKGPSPKGRTPKPTPIPIPMQYRETIASAQQALVVTTADWNSVDGTLQRYEKQEGKWLPIGEKVPVVVGKSGLAWDGALELPAKTTDPVKKEGDGRSPAGVFKLSQLFGFDPSAAESRLPYLPLNEYTECVDDPSSNAYNQIVNTKQTPNRDWQSSEKMRQIDAYKLGIVVDYNSQNIPGSGSCIFMHIWSGAGQGTAGCTAMEQAKLTEVADWLDTTKMPVLVQFPGQIFSKVRQEWGLP
jgi:D-alanyl-D-alanine dipeptidase